MIPHDVEPVRPLGMEIAFHYECPYCGKVVRVNNPLKPMGMVCPQCRGEFPIVPADRHLMTYLSVMTVGGRAAVNEEY